MKDPDNESGRIIARKTKNIVMLAMDHSQARIERGHIFEKTLARRNAVHIGLQLCHIATGLRVAPLFACIADNVAQISFRRQGEGITGGQRSEERRVGKECVSTCRSRWSPCHYKPNKQNNKRIQYDNKQKK